MSNHDDPCPCEICAYGRWLQTPEGRAQAEAALRQLTRGNPSRAFRRKLFLWFAASMTDDPNDAMDDLYNLLTDMIYQRAVRRKKQEARSDVLH